jgi:hypothetical protein
MYWGIQWCYGVSRLAVHADAQVQAIAAVVSCILNVLVLRETRGDVILSRRAKRLTKETGIRHVCATDLQRQGFLVLVSISLVRPLRE